MISILVPLALLQVTAQVEAPPGTGLPANPPGTEVPAPPVRAMPQMPPLDLTQQTTLRCVGAIAFQAQDSEDGGSGRYGVEAGRGREFFVRASARLMEEASLTREQFQTALVHHAAAMSDRSARAETIPACLLLLEASGL